MFISCSCKNFEPSEKFSHSLDFLVIEIPSKLVIPSLLCPNLSYAHVIVHYYVMQLWKDTFQTSSAQPFILPKRGLIASAYDDGCIDLQERLQDSDRLPQAYPIWC